MFDENLYQETISALHASEDTLSEVMNMTPTEETLQARNDELERHVDAKADTIEIMRRGVRIRNGVVAIMFLIIVFLTVWCVYIDLHCIDYGFWRG